MNNALLEAKRATAKLEKREKGKFVLVREQMISFFMDTCKAIDEALATIPQTLKKHNLSDIDGERTQRAILREGFPAVEEAALAYYERTLEKGGILVPSVRRKYALEQEGAVCTEALKQDIEAIVREVRALNTELLPPMDLEGLWFRSGKLRVPPKYLEGIAPACTLEVPEKDFKTVEQIRTAAAILAELKARGVQIADDMQISPANGKPYLSPGLITRMASGAKYTDAELLGMLQGINLTH